MVCQQSVTRQQFLDRRVVLAFGQAAATFEGRFWEPPRPYPGQWALFRMIDDSAAGPPDAQERISLNIRNTYHHVLVTIDGSRSFNNPLAAKVWREFSCEP